MNRHVKIVLPCVNEGEWLRATIDSILEHTEYSSFEIFVMANGDQITDFSFVEESPYRQHVRLRRVKEPLGVGNSINESVVPGDASYYVFLDAHCLVEQHGWLHRAIACLDENPHASMIQPEVLHFTYDGELESAGDMDPSRIKKKRFEYSIRWAWPYEDPIELAEALKEPPSSKIHEGMAGGGMAVFVSARTFHELGKYDPEVSGWYPETMDYCVRSWLLDRPMLVEPGIRVLHRQKQESRAELFDCFDRWHGFLRTAYKYLSPRRRDLAEILLREHGLGEFVDRALQRLEEGRWLEERARHLRERVHDDDWLFHKFEVYEARD